MLRRLGLFVAAVIISSSAFGQVVINEIDYDQIGTDGAEFVELKNTSGGVVNLDNYTVQLVNGNAGGAVVYDTIDLPNVNLPAGGYYVICTNAANVPNCNLVDAPLTDFIQNGSPDAVGLRLSGVLIDAISYEGNTGAPYTETAGVPNVAASSDSNAIAFIGLSRFPDGTDTNNNSVDVTIRCITPGVTNVAANAGCLAPPFPPNLTVTDVTQAETNAGTTTFNFQVNLSAPAGPGGVTFDIATADGTAEDDNPAVSEDNDYVAQSLTPPVASIAAGNSSFPFSVTVNGDLAVEGDENFFVNVTNVTGAIITDGQGQGTIQNDDAACATLSINDVSQVETDAGTTTFAFTVSLSQAGCGTVTFDIATADGTAEDDNPAVTEDNDYVAQSLTGQTITFPATYAFNVSVNGDATPEPDQTFFVNLTNVSPANVQVGDPQGLGTIVNDDFTRIHDIQGPSATSPLSGVVTTRGIVTGAKSNGFFIQEPDATVDANPMTSEGIFVFTSAAPPAAAAVGNLVEVTGTIAEFVPSADPQQPPVTELTSPTTVQLSTGNPLPAPIPLNATFPDPTGPFDQLERLEGMRVSAPSITVVAPSDGSINEPNNTGTSNGRFHGVITGVARPLREPGIRHPDVPPVGSVPPIPRWDTNPELLRIESATINAQPILTVKTGDVVAPVTGVLDYSFRGYAVYPDGTLGTPVVTPGTLPTMVTTPTTQEFTVASWNMFHFYDTVNDPEGDVALTAGAFADRLAKASIAIRNHLQFPDILGVQEMEHLSTLQTLATQINNDAVANSQPNPMYVPFLSEGNDIGGIDVGFLVKTAPVPGGAPRVFVNSVTQIGATDTWIDPDDGMSATLNDRPSLVLDAVVNRGPGATFPVVVINNHLRSLIGIDSNAPDGLTTEGDRVRRKRQTQADRLAFYIQGRLTSNANEHIVLVGDFNAFEFNDGYADIMNTLGGTPTPDNQTVVCSTCPTLPNTNDGVDQVNPDLTNLVNTPPPAERYSFVFDGNAQNLDHAVISAGFVTDTSARRIEHPRIGADYPETERSNNTTPIRTSDHDPVVAFFQVAGFAVADVSLTKTLDTSGPFLAGQSVTYTINVANAGPDTATNIQVMDTPTNLSITSVSGSGCSSLPCNIPSLAAGANTNITVTATIVAAGAFDNSASANATEADPNTGNNTDNTGNGGTAAASADVSITKTLDTAGPYFAGQSVTYTINVANAGPSTATNITVTDTPTNLSITGVSGSGCASLPCSIASINSGANTSISVTATIVAASAFDNSANATATENDPNTADNTDNTGNGGTAAGSADVSITKTLDTAGPYFAGASVTYTITVANAGPSTATNVNVTDTPTNLNITGVSGACASFSPCTIASIASGANTTITVTATIVAAGAFDNEATATAAEFDPNTANNTDNTGNGGTASGVDVSVQKNLTTAGPYYIGQTINYSIQVENNGPDAATNIQVTDTPTNLTVTSVNGSGCSSLPCTIPGPFAGGASTFIFVDATINSVGAFDNSATATQAEPDSNPANNTDNTGNGGVAVAAADVTADKALVTSGPYFVGQSLTFTVTVANAGTSTANNIQVTDTPTNLTITSVSGACAAFPCTIASLGAGANAVINVTATIVAAGIFDNSATATADEFDPNATNNTDNAAGTTGNAADLSVVKSIITAGPYKLGQTGVQWQIVVANAGPDTATNVQVTDTPIGVSFTSVSGGGCTSFPCTIPSLANGANVTINMTGNINTTGSFDNSATVSATEFDPNTANNSDLFGNGGVASNAVDVAITKTLDTAGSYFVGQAITYTLVVSNVGPGVALFVEVTDTPTNLTITSVSGAGCTAFPCTLVPGVTPTPASNRTITVVATINAAGAFANSATATKRSSDIDNDPSNDTDNTGNGGTATVNADTDGDGVADTFEQAAPNGGDANGDGIPDYQQGTVASIPAATGSGYLTLQSSCTLQQVYVTTEGALPTSDPGFDYPHGLIAFRAPCSSATFSLFVYGGSPVSGYRKFGPLPPGGPQQWYVLPGATHSTATVGSLNPRRIDFSLTDGGTGDDTPVDGVIVDQGGPPGAGGIPTLSEWALMALAMALAAFAALKLRA